MNVLVTIVLLTLHRDNVAKAWWIDEYSPPLNLKMPNAAKCVLEKTLTRNRDPARAQIQSKQKLTAGS